VWKPSPKRFGEVLWKPHSILYLVERNGSSVISKDLTDTLSGMWYHESLIDLMLVINVESQRSITLPEWN